MLEFSYLARLRAATAMLLCSWLLGWLGGAAAWGAQAATVLATKVEGNVTPAALRTLDDALARALREQQITVIGAGERDAMLSSESKLAGCGTDSCLERLGRLLGSQLVVGAQVKARAASEGALDWELSVDVFDIEVGAQGARGRSECSACTPARAAQTLAEVTQQAVLESAGRPRGALAITSTPPSAIVFVDGTELGITPYKRPTFAGKHHIVVRSTGHKSYQSDVDITESQRQTLTVSLQLGAADEPPRIVEKPSTPVYKKWWFWVALGGAAAAAGGITAGVLLGTREVVPNGTPAAFHIHF